MQVQLNPFHMFAWKVVLYYYCLEKGTKSGKIYCNGPFSTLIHIGHVTGGSVRWPMCNIPTLLQIQTKKQRMHWVMVLVQSIQKHFPFKAHLNLFVFGLTCGTTFYSVKVRDSTVSKLCAWEGCSKSYWHRYLPGFLLCSLSKKTL